MANGIQSLLGPDKKKRKYAEQGAYPYILPDTLKGLERYFFYEGAKKRLDDPSYWVDEVGEFGPYRLPRLRNLVAGEDGRMEWQEGQKDPEWMRPLLDSMAVFIEDDPNNHRRIPRVLDEWENLDAYRENVGEISKGPDYYPGSYLHGRYQVRPTGEDPTISINPFVQYAPGFFPTGADRYNVMQEMFHDEHYMVDALEGLDSPRYHGIRSPHTAEMMVAAWEALGGVGDTEEPSMDSLIDAASDVLAKPAVSSAGELTNEQRDYVEQTLRRMAGRKPFLREFTDEGNFERLRKIAPEPEPTGLERFKEGILSLLGRDR